MIPEICWKTVSTLGSSATQTTQQKSTKTASAEAASHKTFSPPPITLNRQKKFVDFLIIDFEPISFPLSDCFFLFIYLLIFIRLSNDDMVIKYDLNKIYVFIIWGLKRMRERESEKEGMNAVVICGDV